MSEYTPTTEEALGIEIARVRRGDDVTASDLANRLMPWLAAHDAEVRAQTLVRDGVVAEEPEWEYGVIGPTGRMVNNGDYTIQQTHRRRKAGPWIPVES